MTGTRPMPAQTPAGLASTLAPFRGPSFSCPGRIGLVSVLVLALVAGVTLSSLAATASGGVQPPAIKYSSSTIAISPDGATLLVVNPDSNSLTLIDTATLTVRVEAPVGVDPRSVAVSPDGVWAVVANQGSDTLTILSLPSGVVLRVLPVGSRPVAVAVSPDGRWLAVAELGADQVRLLDAATFITRAVIPVGDRPHGLAFTPDGRRLLVTHLLSGEVTFIPLPLTTLYLPLLFRGGAAAPLSRLAAPSPPTPLSVATWPGVAPAPSVLINSSGTRAYLPQTMANGLGLNTGFDTSVFPKVSVLNLSTNQHETAEHISLPEKDQPVGLPWEAALARGDRELWVVNAASNDVSVLDISSPRSVRRTAHILVADNPRGIVLHPDGRTAYVNNVLAGTVSVIDTSLYTVTAVVTTTTLPLPPVLLNGKRLFHSSALPELSLARWISCYTCHVEGEHDGRTWLLQYTGAVPPGAAAVITRNTTSLLGMIETYPLRWSAEWDESADSEFSIRMEQFGTGLIQGVMHPTLGPPNQGRSFDLDCLASYIDSLELPRPRQPAASTLRGNPDNGRTASQGRGRSLFFSSRTGCSLCHPAPLYTDQRPHDVGTADSYGEWFGPAIDTPSLRLLYDSAPYLHDGSAAKLKDVLTTANRDDRHGRTSDLSDQELDDLAAFMLTLPGPPGDEPFTYSASSCLGQISRGPERIDIRVEGSDIVMAHHDASYNCCAQMVVYYEDLGPIIKLTEVEEYPDQMPCRCLCSHELGARVFGLPPGKYRIQVWDGPAQALLTEVEVLVPSLHTEVLE